MDYLHHLDLSYYKTIAVINEAHHVYLVQHQSNQKIYIKKILDIYNPDIYQYLSSHKITGIPQIIDTCEENNQLTVIEEFVSGTSLQERLSSGKLSEKSIIHYMSELCDILEKLHSLHPPIVHRDIKPSNIIITSYDHVMLLDFNAAKYLTNVNATDTVLLGTKGYAAPEQYGFGSSTPQTDIYALGILLKELSSASSISTDIISKVIEKCTKLNPGDRFQSVAELKQAISPTSQSSDIAPAKKFSLKSLILPGFRTLTPWKMIVAGFCYFFIFALCLTLKIKDAFGIILWIQRIFTLLIMLAVICFSFNYLNIQRVMPLCKRDNWILHYIGIILWDAIIFFSLFFIMVILVSSL